MGHDTMGVIDPQFRAVRDIFAQSAFDKLRDTNVFR